MADPDTRSRMRGCLLGGAVGDALGAPVEFMSRAAIRSAFGAQGLIDLSPAYGRIGAVTDDTQMTLFTAEGMLRAYVRWSSRGIVSLPDMLERAYLRWLLTQQLLPPAAVADTSGWLIQQRELHARRAPGRTCVSALQQPAPSLRAANHSKGCGGVMRVAPVGLFHGVRADASRAFEVACEAAAITHGHPTGQLASGAFAAMIAALMQGYDLEAATLRALAELHKHAAHHEVAEALREAMSLAAARDVDPDLAIARLGGGWVAEEALAIALYCALREPTLERALILAVNHDGDSDSTGSIAGQLLGTVLGEPAIPERWRNVLELASVIVQVADDLHDVHGIDFDRDTPAVRDFERRYPGG